MFFCFTIHKKLNKSCSLKKKFLFLKKKILSLKKTLKFFFVSGTHRGGFQCIMILTLQGVTFHPVVVIGLGKNLLFKSVLAHCDIESLCRNLEPMPAQEKIHAKKTLFPILRKRQKKRMYLGVQVKDKISYFLNSPKRTSTNDVRP